MKGGIPVNRRNGEPLHDKFVEVCEYLCDGPAADSTWLLAREDDWRALKRMALELGMPVPSGRYLDFKRVMIEAMWNEIKRREHED